MAGKVTPKKSLNLRSPWQPGESGNPVGRPTGARSKLSEAFLKAVHDDFVEHGVEALESVRENDPSTYLRVIASLMPRNVKLNVNTTDTVDLLKAMNEFRLSQQASNVVEIDPAGRVVR